MNDSEQVLAFLSEQKYMTVAVTLDDGSPWATPVRIKKRDGNLFEWDSKTDTEHSRAITARPRIAIAIYTPETEHTIQFGFYAHATAEQIGQPNEHGIARYRANVTKCYVNDASFIKREVRLLQD